MNMKPKSLLTKERFDHIKLKKNRIKIDKKNFFRLYGLIADYMDWEKYVDERAYKRRFANDSIDRAKYVMWIALENFFNVR